MVVDAFVEGESQVKRSTIETSLSALSYSLGTEE